MKRLVDGGGAPSLDGTLFGDDDALWTDLLSFPTAIDSSDGGGTNPRSPAPSSSSSSSSSSPDAERRVFSPATISFNGSERLSVTDSVDVDDEEKVSVDALASHRLASASSMTGSMPAKRHKSLLESLWEQELMARTAAAPERKQTPSASLTWIDPSATLLQVAAKPLPNADTMEMRRLKNREGMRLARRRQRDDFNRLKASVAQLEKQYAELCMRDAPGLEDVVALGEVPSETTSGHPEEKQKRQYLLALALAKRLRAENLYLKAGLQQHSTWKQHLHRILDSTVDPLGDLNGVKRAFGSLPSTSSPGSSPSISTTGSYNQSLPPPSMVLLMNLMDAQQADEVFKFAPLDELVISQVMVDNAYQTQEIRTSLMAAVSDKDPHARRHFVLGWDVIQRVRGSYMEYMYTKTFRDIDVDDAGQRMWMNDMQTDSFRRVLSELRRIEVLQRVSSNAYILGRDVKPFDGNTVFRSVFMRFRTQVSREIPNGSSPPLRATGFVIGSHSVNRDWSSPSLPPQYRSHRSGDGDERPADLHDGEALEWADIALLTEFVTIEDPRTGDKYHQIQWVGRTDFKSHVEALRNMPDVLSVCLRTELLLFRPAVQLLA
jgi:hypothetical protein